MLILSLFFYLTLQNDVKSPKSTRHSCPVTWSLTGGQDEIKTVELVIETTPAKIDWKPTDESNLGESSKATGFTAGQRKIVIVVFTMN